MSEPLQLQCLEVWGGNEAVSTAIAMPGMDAWIYSKPHGGAAGGGDVHYASSCAAGAIARMLLADVSGHGLAVSDIAMRLRKLMRRHINHHKQTRLVSSMNQEFAGLTKDGKFATAVAFSYDAPINRLQICNAGHPPPLIYRNKTSRWSYLEPRDRNIPLGIEVAVDYCGYEAPIEVADIVIAYTDGLPECRLNDGTMLGTDGLLKLMQTIDVADLSQIIPNLLAKIESIGKIEDDLTLLLFRPNGRPPSLPERLLAPLRMLRALVQSPA